MPSTTSNMSLLIPLSGEATYVASVSSSLTTVDSHTHAAGSGVQIETAAIASNAVTGAKLNANTVDNSTLELVASQLRVKDAGVTRPKLVAVGQQISASAVFVTSSGVYVDVTNLSVSITTTGRPVVIMMVADGVGSSFLRLDYNGAGTTNIVSGSLKIVRGATDLTTQSLAIIKNVAESDLQIIYPTGLFHLDPVAAGTYTYKIQALVFEPDTQLAVAQMKLVAYEL